MDSYFNNNRSDSERFNFFLFLLLPPSILPPFLKFPLRSLTTAAPASKHRAALSQAPAKRPDRDHADRLGLSAPLISLISLGIGLRLLQTLG